MRVWVFAVPIVLAFAATGCVKGSPGSPTSGAVADEPDFPAGSVITIVSGETGAPVPGASLSIAGRQIAADASGQVTLPEQVVANTPVEVSAAAYLDRVTRLRSREAISLWPKQSPTGLDETYSAMLVYGMSPGSAPGGDPLYRLGRQTRQVYLVPTPELQRDSAAMNALQHAADRIRIAMGGGIGYSVNPSAPAGVVRFDVKLDPAASSCQGVFAFTSRSLRGSEITGGTITFCSVDAAHGPTVTHEVGHTFGFRHGPDGRDLMYGISSPMRATDFGARESLAAQMMLLRPAGNRWPDNDREVTSAAVRSTTDTIDTIICR
jgi:hypothetical protein